MKINGKPDGGGGGGVITGLSVSANGTYIATGGVDGYSPVEVSVPEQKPEETFSVTPSITEQTVTPQEGYVFSGGTVASVTSTIDANIQAGNIKSGVTILGVEGNYTAPAPVTESLSVSVNGTYTPGQGVDGYSLVNVSVPQDVEGYTLEQVVEGNLGISVLSTPASEMKTIGCWSTVTAVNMPNLKTLPSQAFYYATALSQLYLPNVEVINELAFYYCNSITSLDLPSCLYFGREAARYCYNLENISLPNCTEIGYDAFGDCPNLSSLSLPSLMVFNTLGSCGISYFELPQTKIFRLEYYTFSYMSRLQKVVMPMVGQMGGYNFYACPSLTEVEINTGNYFIPNYTETFYDTPFNSGIGSIYVAANMLEKWQSAEGWSNFSSLFVGVGDSTSTMLSITSEGLVYGETNATWWNVSNTLGEENIIKEVSLPNCKIIADIAFASNYTLSSVNCPVAENIGWQTFVDCYSLQTVNLPACKKIDAYAFQNCYSLQTVNLPACKKIDAYAFQNCSSLQTISLPLCEEIGYYAFQNCLSLSEMVLPVCSNLGNNPLEGCNMLSKLVLGSTSVCRAEYIFFQFPGNVSILVPPSLVDAYKADGVWMQYSSRIFPIE